MKKLIVVLSGAGMSAESGLKTFRDANGLWEGHNVTEVATPEGFEANPDLVHQFYNERRKQLLKAQPNAAHRYLAELEEHFKVWIVTQNVDDLHERAGSSQVLHLHGELLKIRSLKDPSRIKEWTEDLTKAYRDDRGHSYRPHIVWFGEAVPLLEEAANLCQQTDICLVIGTSLQVYPAASLLDYCTPGTPVFYIDPKPSSIGQFRNREQITTLPYSATEGVKFLDEKLKKYY